MRTILRCSLVSRVGAGATKDVVNLARLESASLGLATKALSASICLDRLAKFYYNAPSSPVARVTGPLRVTIRRVFSSVNRVAFLIDGFNLYHSVVDLGRHERLRAKWLDIHSLCCSYLYLFGRDASLVEVRYFSAYAYHLNNASVVKRHQDYIECLKCTGVIPEMGRFKPKDVTCLLHSQLLKTTKGSVQCPLRGQFTKHEEKETDVAIAARLFGVLFSDECDTAILVTGDTDLAPAVRTCKRLFPSKSIVFAFPYWRYNRELHLLLPSSFRIHAKSYVRHLFPDPVRLSDGTTIHKPSSW